MKVLVADDHSVFRTGLVQVLRVLRRDVEVVEATDFEDALRAAAGSDRFDLVLVDLLMPGMEPFEGDVGSVRRQEDGPEDGLLGVDAVRRYPWRTGDLWFDDRCHRSSSVPSSTRPHHDEGRV